jgi:DNA-binding NarL/FixJ family response regulator
VSTTARIGPTVLVADDHLLVRSGIKMLVSGALARAHFLEASDCDSLLEVMDSNAVSLALIDWNLPRLQGGTRLAQVAQRHPKTPIVVISSFTSPGVVRRAMAVATVRAFVAKSGSVEDIHSAIRAAMQGERKSLAGAGGDIGPHPLTPRQREIRDLVRQGMSNKLIAGALGISEGTVKNHLSEIFRILKTTNRTQLAQLHEAE